MIEEIIELLPSADVKAKIRQTDHHFSEAQLLQIIYQYAPSFEERLGLFARFAKIASPDISALTNALIHTEQKNFKRFVEETEGFVYELHIKETPDSVDESYICASYAAALACIDLFYEKYADIGVKETDKTRYKITKRKIFSGFGKFEEDAYAECVLGANKTVLKVKDYNDSTDCDLEISCSACSRICPRRPDDLFFPCFAHDRAVIKYPDFEGKEHFGICLCEEKTCDRLNDCFCVIPLDSWAICYHQFEEDFCCHVHVELPLAELVAVEELEETMRKDYFEYVAYLDSKKP